MRYMRWFLANVSGCFALLDVFFPGFDLDLFTLDIKAEPVVDAHVLIRDPYQSE
jgi:hypothetical protein